MSHFEMSGADSYFKQNDLMNYLVSVPYSKVKAHEVVRPSHLTAHTYYCSRLTLKTAPRMEDEWQAPPKDPRLSSARSSDGLHWRTQCQVALPHQGH